MTNGNLIPSTQSNNAVPPNAGKRAFRWVVYALSKAFRLFNSCTRSTLGFNSTMTPSFRFIAVSRCSILVAMFVLLFVLLSMHVFELQVTSHENYKEMAERRARKTDVSSGKRGRIFDANGTILADNIVNQTIRFEPKKINAKYRDEIAAIMARILDIPTQEILDRFNAVVNEDVQLALDCSLTEENAKIIDMWKLNAVTVVPPAEHGEQYQLLIRPKACTTQELERTVDQLSHLVRRSPKDIKEQIKKAVNKPREVIVKNNVDYETALLLKQSLEAYKQKVLVKDKKKLYVPIGYNNGNARCYAQGQLLSNVVGFTNHTGKGAAGIEQLFNEHMTPTPGKISYQKDSKGRKIPGCEFNEVPAQNGADIYLTIQTPIQFIVEQELEKAITKYNPDRAYAIMMDPKTGAIMALAQYPTFNPNDRETFSNIIGTQNHFLTETFDPGSIMKPIPVSYALDRNITTLDTIYDCERGAWRYGGATLHDSHPNEYLSTRSIIAESSNIGTAKIALEMGEKTLYEAMKAFGFGAKTGLGFIPKAKKHVAFGFEQPGLLRSPYASSRALRWDALTITRIPIGQGISCTSMQLLQAYSAIANKGVMMQPYVIDKIVEHDNTVTYSVPTVKARPISPLGADKITQALVAVVNTSKGTGKRAALKDFTVAGKTGTAQIVVNGAYTAKYFTASFIGFAPAENPAFTLIVTLKGVHGVHGGTACAPVFREIARKTLDYLNIQPIPQEQSPQQTINQTTRF